MHSIMHDIVTFENIYALQFFNDLGQKKEQGLCVVKRVVVPVQMKSLHPTPSKRMSETIRYYPKYYLSPYMSSLVRKQTSELCILQ